MKNKYRQLVLRLQETQGKLDAATGTPPRKTSKTYINSYSHQYAYDQIMTARSEAPF
jgi:hypothetical protein